MVSFVHRIQRQRCYEVVRSFLHIVRWKTLVASLAPSVVVLALALNQGRPLAFFPFFCCGPSPFLLQIGCNLVNDALDFTRGVDGWKRLGPKRIFSRRAALWCYVVGVLCFPAAFLFTFPAIRLRGPIVLKLEIACAVAGYLYTGWPFPYGYYALGDIAVFIFFGVVYFVLASFIIQGGPLLEAPRLVAGCQLGWMSTNLLVINNLRDIDSDRLAGKHTISNLVGYEKGRWELVWSIGLVYVAGLWWAKEGHLLAFLLPLLTLPFAISCIGDVFATKPSVRYNLYLQRFAALYLVFAGLLAMGLISPRLFNNL